MSAGLDTINRRLLEGARRHSRDAVFARRSRDGSIELTPDWRADRHALRVALALSEGLGVGAGDVVTLWMPLGLEWPLVERGVWALGAVSQALPPQLGVEMVRRAVATAGARVVFCPTVSRAVELGLPPTARALVALEGKGERELVGYDELMEQGGVLDTPERATRCRAGAGAVSPEAPASIEVGPDGLAVETRTQGDWARDLSRFLERYPPARSRCLVSDEPDAASRCVLYAGWADGRTRTVLGLDATEGALVFGREPAGTPPERFVNLTELERRLT